MISTALATLGLFVWEIWDSWGGEPEYPNSPINPTKKDKGEQKLSLSVLLDGDVPYQNGGF